MTSASQQTTAPQSQSYLALVVKERGVLDFSLAPLLAAVGANIEMASLMPQPAGHALVRSHWIGAT